MGSDWYRWEGSNLRPRAYETRALGRLSYIGVAPRPSVVLDLSGAPPRSRTEHRGLRRSEGASGSRGAMSVWRRREVSNPRPNG